MTKAHEQVKNGNVLTFLKNYWFILIAIVGISIGWAEIRSGVSFNTQVNAKQEVGISANSESLRVLDLRYAEDVTFIKTTLQQLQKENGIK